MGGRSVANAHGDLLVWLDGMKQQRVTESYTSIAHTKKNAIFVCVVLWFRLLYRTLGTIVSSSHLTPIKNWSQTREKRKEVFGLLVSLSLLKRLSDSIKP